MMPGVVSQPVSFSRTQCTKARLLLAVIVAIGVTPAASTQPAPAALSAGELRKIRQQSPLPALRADATNRYATHPEAALLGQQLFFDVRFSGNGKVSCATCHDPQQDFHDGKALAEGISTMTRHTPSLWHVARQRWFFWDGRSDSLWAQALDPIEVPGEMAGSRTRVVRLLRDDAQLRRTYESVFGSLPATLLAPLPDDARPAAPGATDELTAVHDAAWLQLTAAQRRDIDRTFVNAGKAIAAYVRRLERGPSPFDAFVAALVEAPTPNNDLLSPSAQRGLALFNGRANCRSCHGGPLFSDGEFHDTGVAPLNGKQAMDAGRYAGIQRLRKSPFTADGVFSDERNGAAAQRSKSVTQTPQNYGRFKTPSLRNVALTAPYMHQGQLPTLEAVVRFYSTREGALPPAHHAETILQPLHLSDAEVGDLVAFLESLTGTPPDPALLSPLVAGTETKSGAGPKSRSGGSRSDGSGSGGSGSGGSGSDKPRSDEPAPGASGSSTPRPGPAGINAPEPQPDSAAASATNESPAASSESGDSAANPNSADSCSV
ncbi:MAG: cytochrome c peroxidase [Planctomycetota bacterium]